MRKMSELEELGFSTLEAYLHAKEFKSDGSFGANVDCDGAGHVHLSLSRGKAALDRHYLVLVPALEPAETLVLPGTADGDGVDFDLSTLGEALFQTCDEWLCHVAMGNQKEFLSARLRENGDAVFLPPAAPAAAVQKPAEKQRSGGLGRLKRLFGGKEAPKEATPAPSAPAAPDFHLWAESKRLHDTGVCGPVEGMPQRLLLRASAKRRFLNLVRQREDRARVLLDGQVLHRCRRPEEDKPFQFSIVMAVYNVAPYLEEAVESVLTQDIGFREHVQLILVDDGSTDGSGLLCSRYAQRYPKNIVALHQENSGAASARNAGLEAATGTYVNFMDPDDKISPNTLSAVSRFFSDHADEVDVACIPLYFFEAKADPYWQNYKHEGGERVIDLWSEWDASDMNTAASFIRLEVTRRFRFDTSLPNGEDVKLLLSVLLEKMRLGVVPQGAYWYRRRRDGNSLINRSKEKRSWYTEYFTNLSFFALEQSKKQLGFVPEFVQNTLMMDLQWRFKDLYEPEGGLTAQQQAAYVQTVSRLLGAIDLPVILAQRKLTLPELLQVLRLKYGKEPRLQPGCEDLHVMLDARLVFSCSELPVFLERVTLEEKALYLEGYVQFPAALSSQGAEQYLLVAGDYYRCQSLPRHSAAVSNNFGPVAWEQGFRVTLPLSERYDGRSIRLVSVVGDRPILHRSYRYGPTCAFYGEVKGQYLWCPEAVLRTEKTSLRLRRTPDSREALERSYLNTLEGQVVTPERQKRSAILPRELTPQRFDQVKALRAAALTQQREKPLWLLCDGMERAGGPAELLFRTLLERPDCPAELCFVLSADSPDFPRLSALGTVLPFGSREHLTAFLQADVVCFSQQQEELLAPFTGTMEGPAQRRYYADLLCRQRYVLLCGSEQEAEVPGNGTTVAQKYLSEPLVLRDKADVQRVLDALGTNRLPV